MAGNSKRLFSLHSAHERIEAHSKAICRPDSRLASSKSWRVERLRRRPGRALFAGISPHAADAVLGDGDDHLIDDYFNRRMAAIPAGMRVQVPMGFANFDKNYVSEGSPPREWVERLYDVRRSRVMPAAQILVRQRSLDALRVTSQRSSWRSDVVQRPTQRTDLCDRRSVQEPRCKIYGMKPAGFRLVSLQLLLDALSQCSCAGSDAALLGWNITSTNAARAHARSWCGLTRPHLCTVLTCRCAQSPQSSLFPTFSAIGEDALLPVE